MPEKKFQLVKQRPDIEVWPPSNHLGRIVEVFGYDTLEQAREAKTKMEKELPGEYHIYEYGSPTPVE